MDRGNLYCGVIYLSHRLGKDLPDMYEWSMRDLKAYVDELEQELFKANCRCK